MKCRRAFDADLVAVLRGEGSDVDFLAHYPTCADCAAELRVWGELDAMLRAGAPMPGTHPSEATLLAFVDAPATLAAESRAEVERHLSTCRACADEAASLRHWDAARASAGAAAPLAAAAPASLSSRGAAAEIAATPSTSWVGRVLLHPAFAYALVAVLLVPLVRDQIERLVVPAQVAESRRETPRAPVSAVLAPDDRHDAPGETTTAPLAGAGHAKLEKQAEPPPEREEARAQAPARSERSNAVDGVASKTAESESDAAPALQDLAAQPAAPQRKKKAAADREPPTVQVADHLGRETHVAAAVRPAAPAELPTVEIHTGGSTVIPFMVATRGLLLRIAPPAGVADGLVDAQVRARTGAPELTQRVAPIANAIALRIPPQWLAAGDYTITLSPVATVPGAAGAANDAAQRGAATFTLGFTVSPPMAASAGR